MNSDARTTIDYHSARLLLLLDKFTNPRKRLVGLTKLAKLDFLLRYPIMFEQLLHRDGLQWPPGSEPTAVELSNVESRMIRYKYGPWDDAYYPVIGSLLSRNLITTRRGSRGAMTFNLTVEGRRLADQLKADPRWRLQAARSSLLSEYYDLTGNQLKDRIYAELPDSVDRPHRTQI
jgi:hypothetical protein